ncbi:hypothetical protein BBJ28_00016532 [Nothophytophthora sp. Chile5]|nr:hypothetical protein BBJ28_00016532 [Nothophytophthora sp. Chile5]
MNMLRVVHAVQTNVTSLCSPSESVPLVVKGEVTYVCINVNDQYRTVFTPVADKFTVLRITDCKCPQVDICIVFVPLLTLRRLSFAAWNDTRIGGSAVSAFLTVSSLKYRSNYKLYSSAITGRFSPYMTAIISVKKGVVQGVSWDDGCFFCDAEMCDYNLYSKPEETSAARLAGEGKTCYSLEESCDGYDSSTATAGSATNSSSSDSGVDVGSTTNSSSTNTTVSCDITVYVGWTGTDRNGDYLGSASLRVSQFTKYSVGSFFSSVAASLSKLVPSSRSETTS